MLEVNQVKNEILERIVQEVATILGEKSLEPVNITETTSLSEISLTSLDLAELVSNLEDQYEVDPFEEMVPITSIVTAGDLASAYSQCLTAGAEGKGDTLAEELKVIKSKIN